MSKAKLNLDKLTDDDVISLGRTVATALDGNNSFPAAPVTTDDLNDLADAMQGKINERSQLEAQIQTKTIAIRNARLALENALRSDADYVDTASGGDAEKIHSAGMRVAEDPAPVGGMPKVTRLAATAGDGEVDLHWDPVRRGAKSYVVERTSDAAGQTGRGNAQIVTKSRAEVTGLQSGSRHWFRVAAVGSAGQGPWSDPATKVAP
ncbi:MAG: hypothetical protein QOD99_1527 [Chthoniobacter sp.]|jgi:hypothetical protein|nr:hypothetical protein [Chthoniobacter sp.]